MRPLIHCLLYLTIHLAAAELSPEAAFAACKTKAAAGDAAAQNELGWRYANGFGTLQNEAEAIIWFRKSAEQGYPNAQRHLGLIYLFGNGVEEDQSAGARWLKLAAEKGDPTAQYYLGQCYLEGLGVAKDIDFGFRWQCKATLQGYFIPADYKPAELAALKEWNQTQTETTRLLGEGQTAKAYLNEKDAYDLAADRLRDKRWHLIASSVRLMEIAAKLKRWPQAYRHYVEAQHGALNAVAEAIEKPAEIVMPAYLTQTTKLQLKREIAKPDGMEGLRLLNEQVAVLEKEFGRGHIFLAPTLKERANAYLDQGQNQNADKDFARYMELHREHLGVDDDIMVIALMDYASHLGRRRRNAEQVEALKEALARQQKTGKISYAFTWIKGTLLKAQVMRRFLDGEEFKPASELPSAEADLRRLADDGDPLACYRLSVGLSSGEFHSKVTLEKAELSPESKLYMDASIVPFIDDTKISLGYFDEKIARRFAKLGHGFALYEISKSRTKQNQVWPKVDGLAGTRDNTEITKESFQLLCLAAEAGVPEAISELGSLAYYGHYNKPADELGFYDPFVGDDGHWYKRIYIPETKGNQLIRRLNDEPVVIRRNYAMAAYFLRKDFLAGKDVNSAYNLGFIYLRGARESSRDSFRGIEYPAILPDKVEAAAYFYACLYAKDFHMASSEGLEQILQQLQLTANERENAQRKAKSLLASRVRG